MRVANAVSLTAQQRQRLASKMRGRRLSARLVDHRRIVLLAALGVRKRYRDSVNTTAHKAASWRSRLPALDLTGLEKDATSPRRPSLIRREDPESAHASANPLLLGSVRPRCPTTVPATQRSIPG